MKKLINQFNPKAFGKLAVLCKGQSPEKEVSLEGGILVQKALSQLGVNSHLIEVNSAKDLWKLRKFNSAFINLHGSDGESGVVQAICQSLNLIYTGSNIQATSIALDKLKTKTIWKAQNIPTAKAKIIKSNKLKEILKIKTPSILKPNSSGSSIGLFYLRSKEDKLKAIKTIKEQKIQCDFIAEELIKGREFTAAMLNKKILPFEEIIPPPQGYDYNAKYQKGLTKYICPSTLNNEHKLHPLIIKAFDSIGVEDYARIDFIINEQNKVFFLEINTIPGMTENSHFPNCAKAAGLNYQELCISMLQLALKKHQKS